MTTDHTAGLSPGFPTPRAMVADNDPALGRIIEGITKSRFWPESAIFVIEDDAQSGVDHVDGHRTIGWVISPYFKLKRGGVDSTYYTQMDMAATPMWKLFTETPDLTPFTAVPNRHPLDEMNPEADTAGLTPLQVAWIMESAAMGFDEITTGRDVQDPNVLDRAIWYSTMGFDTPFPGDARVLWPNEVSRAELSAEDTAEEVAEHALEGA